MAAAGALPQTPGFWRHGRGLPQNGGAAGEKLQGAWTRRRFQTFPKIVFPFSVGDPILPFEPMAHNLSVPAPGKTAMRPKNRVWGFSRNDRNLPLENRLRCPELRRKSRPTPTNFTPGIPQWPSRDPIEEDGGVNLYGFVGNDGIGRREYLGLVAADPKAMIDTVHQGSIEAHKASEVEYLAQIKKENPNVTTLGNPPVNGGRPYKPKMPREYGGRVCEKCTKDDNGTLVYSYYLTQKFGPWPHTTFKAEIYLGDSPGCVDDKQVAWWHTHPSSLGRDKVGNGRTVKYRYYWNGDSGFSGADKGLVTNPMQNKDALPVFVTYRHLISEHEWDYYTDMYPPGMTVKKTSMKPEWVDLGDIEP